MNKRTSCQTDPILILSNKEVVFGLFIEVCKVNLSKVEIIGWMIGDANIEIYYMSRKIDSNIKTLRRDDVQKAFMIPDPAKALGFNLIVDKEEDLSKYSLSWSYFNNGGRNKRTFDLIVENIGEEYLTHDTLKKLGCASHVEKIDKNGIQGWVAFTGYVGRSVICKFSDTKHTLSSCLATIERNDVKNALHASTAFQFLIPLNRIDPDTLKQIKNDLSAESTLKVNFSKSPYSLPFNKEQFVELLAAAENAIDIYEVESRGEIEIKHASMDNVDNEKKLSTSPTTKAIAFYLPQYHRLPENDEWWGNGFTDWTNVSQARPAFVGHFQPHIPKDLGFYDASTDSTLKSQIVLAEKYGLTGFCFYYYWFAGKRMLSKPLDVFVKLKHNFKFMLCWANENWTRRWDGLENDILMSQKHIFSQDVSFIDDILPYLSDERYISHFDGRKWLLVYRPSLIQYSTELFAAWRQKARDRGISLHISAIDGFSQFDHTNLGVDSYIQFPPLNYKDETDINDEMIFNQGFETATVYDYKTLRDNYLSSYTKSILGKTKTFLFPGVAPGWDNSPRKKKSAHIFFGSTPDDFYSWVKNVCKTQALSLPPENRFLFINAWNEWAEGAHLEPDLKFGCRFLEALNQALIDVDSETNPASSINSFLSTFSNSILRNILKSGSFNVMLGCIDISYFTKRIPSIIERTPPAKRSLFDQAVFCVEQVNGENKKKNTYYLFKRQGLHIKGWISLPTSFQHKHPVFFCLHGEKEVKYWTISSKTYQRNDIKKDLLNDGTEMYSLGYELNSIFDDEILSGRYEVYAYIAFDEGDSLRGCLVDMYIISIELL